MPPLSSGCSSELSEDVSSGIWDEIKIAVEEVSISVVVEEIPGLWSPFSIETRVEIADVAESKATVGTWGAGGPISADKAIAASPAKSCISLAARHAKRRRKHPYKYRVSVY
jgi:hypothetical protein